MSLNASAIQVGAAAIAADIDTAKLHTGDPGAAGTSNTTTAGSQTIALSASGGDISLSAPVDFTGGVPSGPCTYVSLWAGATFRGAYALSGDQTFNAAGEYSLTALDVTGSST